MSSENWGSAPPDATTSRAYWRLLDAALVRANELRQGHNNWIEIDSACCAYADSLTPAAKQIIAKRAREP